MKAQAERMAKDTASELHDAAVRRRLRDSQSFAIQYLKSALENDDPGAFLVALRRIVVARGVLTKAAKAAGIERESLYRALSAKGNPRLSTLVAVTRAVGLRLTAAEAVFFFDWLIGTSELVPFPCVMEREVCGADHFVHVGSSV